MESLVLLIGLRELSGDSGLQGFNKLCSPAPPAASFCSEHSCGVQEGSPASLAVFLQLGLRKTNDICTKSLDEPSLLSPWTTSLTIHLCLQREAFTQEQCIQFSSQYLVIEEYWGSHPGIVILRFLFVSVCTRLSILDSALLNELGIYPSAY